MQWAQPDVEEYLVHLEALCEHFIKSTAKGEKQEFLKQVN